MTLWDFTEAFEEALRVVRPAALDMQALRYVVTDRRLDPIATLGVRFDPITLVVFHQTGTVWPLTKSAQAALRLGLTIGQALDYIDASDNPAHLPGPVSTRVRPIREILRVSAHTALSTPVDLR